MAYARLDDVFPEHPKVVALSDRAFRTHVRGICYSAKVLSDGFVPLSIGRGWDRKATLELEDAGLWLPTATGWFVHDYLEYNPTRAEVEAKRDSQRTQRSAAGKARSAGAQRVAGKFAGTQPPAPSPTPTHPPGVGVDLEPHTLSAESEKRAGAAPENGKPKGKHLGDLLNLGLVTSLLERKPSWSEGAGSLSASGLQKLVNDHGAPAVNAAIDSLYEHANEVRRPFPYLQRVASEHTEPVKG